MKVATQNLTHLSSFPRINHVFICKLGFPAGYGIAIVSYVQMKILCITGQNVIDRVNKPFNSNLVKNVEKDSLVLMVDF